MTTGARSGSKYTRAKTIFVDVDRTLFLGKKINVDLVEWIRDKHNAGFEIIIWSSRGTEYAKLATDKAGLSEIVLCSISKPGYIIDDQGWSWINYTKVLRPFGKFK